MGQEWTRELQLKLEEYMSNRDFLRNMGWSKKDLALTLRQASFRKGFREIMLCERFTCKQILDLGMPVIASISAEPDGGWLNYCFMQGKHVLYPENFPDLSQPEYEKGSLFFMELLHGMLAIEEMTKGFSPTLYYSFATPEEYKGCGAETEYRRFLNFCRETYLVEFMRIGAEITPFNTLGHIAGVHHVAMSMARQLHALGVQVDLALMSGAAVGHDIGKYGCKDSEARRVPYLHYYYTDQCMKRNRMPGIGYIAANHSTWDLELENLSVESLLLIYADFRVKSVRDKEKKEKVRFYTLADSFQVILDKLDNVDDAKRARYRKVYEKLADFEAYMVRLGARPDQLELVPEAKPQMDTALICGDQIVDAYKHQAIAHNIRLMHILNYEAAFANILEAARSEKDWKNTRSYLNIFEEYCTYMNPKQKLMTINFLYELLMHREGDIRQKAARLMGRMIVNYDTEYRKEIPDGWLALVQEGSGKELFQKYMQRILSPDHKIMEKHREWLGYMLEYFLDSVMKHCKGAKRQEYLSETIRFYESRNRDTFTAFVMMTALLKLPLFLCDSTELEVLLDFVRYFSESDQMILQVAALRFLRQCLDRFKEDDFVRETVYQIWLKMPCQSSISTGFLRHQIALALELRGAEREQLEELYDREGIISTAFLENLKTATPWICKLTNIEFLQYMMEVGKNHEPVHTTTHLANLLTVSECSDVRHKAGVVLVEFAKTLSLDQLNEVSVELTKGLELGENEFTKFIPEYLGCLILMLQPAELDEFIRSLENMFIHDNEQVDGVILDTIGVLIQKYPEYKNRYQETEEAYEERRQRLMGFILRGLANYHDVVSQEAFYVIGEYIFGTDRLSLEQKYEIFRYMGKKTLHIMMDHSEHSLSFLINAAALNNIYRFLADYTFAYGGFQLDTGGKVAFFPGTFDPFSLSHRGIVQEIRSHGFEVYLAIDEFSWSKKTQPRLIRRKIAAMSVADDSDVFLFPDDIPVNIANNNDLKRLVSLFPTKQVYMVVGSDVLDHASAYRQPMEEYSIHQFNHIVFRRYSEESQKQNESTTSSIALVNGEVLELSLPVQLEDISSTRIRENIDMNRDISHLIDPVAQNYIYQNNLYLREPQYKPVLRSRSLRYEVIRTITEEIRLEMAATVLAGKINRDEVLNLMKKPGMEMFLIRDEEQDSEPLGFSLFQPISLRNVKDEFHDFEMATRIRDHVFGRVILIHGGFLNQQTEIYGMRQILLTETLAQSMKDEYTCALYHGVPGVTEHFSSVEELLARYGFLKLSEDSRDDLVMCVDMSDPITLTKNIEMVIKAPFNTNPKVLRVINKAHERLQKAMARFRPGQLVISFDSTIMHHRMVDKITEENQVPNKMVTPRILGDKMCVPFGKMIRGSVVPNTVTKALHTERVFHDDMIGFEIEEFPNYSPLRTQIRTIKSFGREVLLVDDLFHKGYRLRATANLFREEGLPICKLITGIMTARGRDTASEHGLEADSVYFLPTIHSWYVESTMYPFIGGDSVRGGTKTPGLLTSVNLVLPYVAPGFLMQESRAGAYEISMVCLENARDILKVLEEEYQEVYERNLTLDRLSEAIYSPTCPDKGRFIGYDLNLPASLYVENDIQRLVRLKNITL